ncbi:50S ribosomal protein L15 [candidate division TM6 bacterium RIFCSPHIGHO2_12_FULL_32_22]|nr:MAG: 50S ribosomal protein L15 [candidate division TM6 bacterium RIFCSPHIGHO2_12_FULL_32_22]
MFKLNKLKKLVKKRKRIGRGGSRGGTSTKGHKGQRARSGGPKGPSFEGGQMPITRRLPKRGFNNFNFKKEFEIISLTRIQSKFSDGELVNKATLKEKNLIKGSTLLKVLNGKEFTKKLKIEADAFSKSAMDSIKNAGGEASLTKEG